MAIIALPNLNRWSSARWRMIGTDTIQETMNGNIQVIQQSPKKRLLQISLINLDETERRLWGLALEQLTSLANGFMAGPPDFKGPASGYSGPNPLVAGSSQLGSSLNVDGATNSTLILSAGDYFTVNGELKRATANVTSSETGVATIPFYPPLRNSPLDNAPVVIDAPVVEFMLLQSDTAMDFDTMLNGLVSINAVEVWR